MGERIHKCVIFRVDGGSGYGVAMGHIFRCLRLAQQVSAMGVACHFCINPDISSKALVENAGFKTHLLPSVSGREDEALFIRNLIADLDGGLVYVDLRGSKKRLIDALWQHNLPVFVYDDVFEDGIQSTVLINPTEVGHEQYNEAGVEYLLGSEYFILDPKFHNYRKSTFTPFVEKLFVSFGGADPCDLAGRFVKLLLNINEAPSAVLAIGPAYQNVGQLEALVEKAGNKVQLCQGNTFLAPLMAEADAAITSGGTIMCESIDLCLPTLVLPTINHEVAISEVFKARGLVASISSDVNDIQDDALQVAIEHFLLQVDLREHLVSAQLSKPPFAGASNIAKRICSYLKTSTVTS